MGFLEELKRKAAELYIKTDIKLGGALPGGRTPQEVKELKKQVDAQIAEGVIQLGSKPGDQEEVIRDRESRRRDDTDRRVQETIYLNGEPSPPPTPVQRVIELGSRPPQELELPPAQVTRVQPPPQVVRPSDAESIQTQQFQQQGIYQSGEADGFFTKILGSRTYFGPVDIQKMKLNLFDEFGRVLQLDNMDWSVALMFECLYS